MSIGKSVLRTEGPEKVSGRTLYTADRLLPRMIWGKALRSPVAHGRIVDMDTTRARALPGVLEVLTARDLPRVLIGRAMRDMPILAIDRVRFIGEKVAVVAAEDPNTAEEAAALIEVQYEELPPVFDPLAAMEEGAPMVHDRNAPYIKIPGAASDLPNVHSHIHWELGSCEEGFAESDFIFEQSFTTQRVHQGYLETHASVVVFGEGDRIVVWSSNKVPYQTRKYLADALGLDESRILVQLSAVGGDFGGKGSLMDIPLCYYLARATGRPCKMVLNSFEELTAGNPRHASVVRLKSGVKKDGRLRAREVRAVFNSGAYAAFKPNPTANLPGARQAAGAYCIPNVRIDALSVYTNCIPCGNMRAPGDPQVIFAVESHTDHIARELGMDPHEFRVINVLKPGDLLPNGVRLESDRGREVLERIGVPLKRTRGKRAYVGKGVAFGVKEVNVGESNVEVGIREDGGTYVLTTVPDTGTGAHTVLRQIVSEILGLSADRVEVVVGSTDSLPTDLALGGSRVTYLAGQAAFKGASALRQLLVGMGADRFRCGADAVRVSSGFLLGPGRGRISFSELARQAASDGKNLRVRGNFDLKERPGAVSFFAQSAEVEVDPATGQVRVLRIVSAHDVGTIINPVGHRGQIEGGMIQGLGYAVMEDLRDEEGRIVTTNLGEYKIPGIRDIPRHEVVFVKEDGPGPFQSKPIGENCNSATAPAIANAVYDAIGVQIRELPITAERTYFAMQRKKGNGA